MFRAITISREYGSGGGAIAHRLAKRLNWRLVEKQVLDEIAARACVSPDVAARYDENVDPWFHRMAKALWRGGFEGAASTVEGSEFDADTMAEFSEKLIREAAAIGQVVIVGRGAQCILQQDPEVFHVAIYAPRGFRIEQLRRRLPPGTDLEAAMAEIDRRRAAYILRYFQQDAANRHLYHLMISSSLGADVVIETILHAAGLLAQTTRK